MNTREPVTLIRNCEAVQIPSGNKFVLPKGSQVKVTQSLGGSYTVITQEGYMARIDAKDADALGMDEGTRSPSVGAAPSGRPEQGTPVDKEQVEKSVWNQLRTVFDPEIPVNVVDLGLIYECKVTPLEGNEHPFRVDVKMTLTAPGCGMGSVLQADAQGKISRIPGVQEARVEMVIDPPWNPSRMSEAAKLQLGMM